MPQYADIIINRKIRAVDRVFTYLIPPLLEGHVQRGMLVQIPFNRELLEGVVVDLPAAPPPGVKLKAIRAVIAEQSLFQEDLLALSAWLADYYLCPRVSALQAMLPAGLVLSSRLPKQLGEDYYLLAPDYQGRMTAKRAALQPLLAAAPQGLSAAALLPQGFSRDYLNAQVKAGFLRRERLTAAAESTGGESTGLNAEQQAAYQQISAERQAGNRPVLLHGITGSGKTEIYLRLLQDQLAAGRQSIVLVPEIALSAQMLAMLGRRLDCRIEVLHSGLTGSQRRRVWQDIAEGKVPVVVGARSAVFAPCPQLGLIILDEEHESSYKQENIPRFQARETARERARLTGAQLVLGSATPAVESYYRAAQGEYLLTRLTKHYYPSPEPQVLLVDMREELRRGNRSIFSEALLAELRQTLHAGAQAILFLNRRGYYGFFACRDCGSSITCPHCAVAMSYHADRHGGKLKCHYCGRILPPPQSCPVCGSSHIRHFGVGTQRVADELSQLLPTARILRLDSDVMAERGAHQRIYQQMQQGEADILVGTQMVAKGLDFANVRLAAVLAADLLLNLPDWRASERTYQLISQLCGRAGRRERQGLALIQTYTPQALAIEAARAQDYQAFYAAELEQRRLHEYPPFKTLLRLLLSSEDQARLAEAAQLAANFLENELAGAAEVCGPAAAPFERIKDRYRWQILLKGVDSARLRQAALRLTPYLQGKKRLLPADLLINFDVDPFSMM